MIQIIAGAKGKGKTKHLLAMANTAMTEAHGTVVYLDKNSKQPEDPPDQCFRVSRQYAGSFSGIPERYYFPGS